MSVVAVPIDDDPGPASLRGYVERNAIALLSNVAGRRWMRRRPRGSGAEFVEGFAPVCGCVDG